MKFKREQQTKNKDSNVDSGDSDKNDNDGTLESGSQSPDGNNGVGVNGVVGAQDIKGERASPTMGQSGAGIQQDGMGSKMEPIIKQENSINQPTQSVMDQMQANQSSENHALWNQYSSTAIQSQVSEINQSKIKIIFPIRMF